MRFTTKADAQLAGWRMGGGGGCGGVWGGGGGGGGGEGKCPLLSVFENRKIEIKNRNVEKKVPLFSKKLLCLYASMG